jgi:hypothetical protein
MLYFNSLVGFFEICVLVAECFKNSKIDHNPWLLSITFGQIAL